MAVDLTAQSKDLSSYVRGGDGKYRTDDPTGSQGGGGPVVVTSATVNGGVLTVNGSGFGTKANAKPLLWWNADMGIAAPSPLGRTIAWDSTFIGELSSAIAAPNSTNAVRLNHDGNTNAILSRVDFTGTQLYMFRRKYDDFDITVDKGSSGFNHKIVRLFDDVSASNGNNIHMGAQGNDGTAYRQEAEVTDLDTFWGTGHNQAPDTWEREELIYQASDLDVQNGIFHFYKGGVLPASRGFITRTTASPNLYKQLFQAQVSNGTGPNAYSYYDCLYVDETWHRVMLSTSPTLAGAADLEPQIIAAHSNSQATAHENLGALSGSAVGKYIYVFDGNGDANANGVQVVAA